MKIWGFKARSASTSPNMSLEFWKDGTFKAVDNQGMAVKGKYTLIETVNIRLEIFRQDSPPEIVNGTFSLQGDLLTFASEDGKEIERYKRGNNRK